MSAKQNDCPVNDKGCPPVITLVADMRFVKWGAKAAIGNAIVVIGALTVAAMLFFGRTVLDSLGHEAVATEIVENAE